MTSKPQFAICGFFGQTNLKTWFLSDMLEYEHMTLDESLAWWGRQSASVFLSLLCLIMFVNLFQTFLERLSHGKWRLVLAHDTWSNSVLDLFWGLKELRAIVLAQHARRFGHACRSGNFPTALVTVSLLKFKTLRFRPQISIHYILI